MSNTHVHKLLGNMLTSELFLRNRTQISFACSIFDHKLLSFCATMKNDIPFTLSQMGCNILQGNNITVTCAQQKWNQYCNSDWLLSNVVYCFMLWTFQFILWSFMVRLHTRFPTSEFLNFESAAICNCKHTHRLLKHI